MYCIHCGLNEQAWEEKQCFSVRGHEYPPERRPAPLQYDQAIAIVRGYGYAIVMPANVEQATQGYAYIAQFRLGTQSVGPGYCLTSEAADALFTRGTIHSADSRRTVLRM